MKYAPSSLICCRWWHQEILFLWHMLLVVYQFLIIILSAFFSPENDWRKRLSRFCKHHLQCYMIASQARFLSFGHSHYMYIRLHSPTLSLIKFVLEKVILLSWLLIVLQFYTRSQEVHVLLKVTWEVSRHGVWYRARRNNSSARNCSWCLTDHDQLRVYMIRILVFSQASNVDKIYCGH